MENMEAAKFIQTFYGGCKFEEGKKDYRRVRLLERKCSVFFDVRSKEKPKHKDVLSAVAGSGDRWRVETSRSKVRSSSWK